MTAALDRRIQDLFDQDPVRLCEIPTRLAVPAGPLPPLPVTIGLNQLARDAHGAWLAYTDACVRTLALTRGPENFRFEGTADDFQLHLEACLSQEQLDDYDRALLEAPPFYIALDPEPFASLTTSDRGGQPRQDFYWSTTLLQSLDRMRRHLLRRPQETPPPPVVSRVSLWDTAAYRRDVDVHRHATALHADTHPHEALTPPLPAALYGPAWRVAVKNLVMQRFFEHGFRHQAKTRNAFLSGYRDADNPATVLRTQILFEGPDFSLVLDPALKSVRFRMLATDALGAERPFLLDTDLVESAWPLQDLQDARRRQRFLLPKNPFSTHLALPTRQAAV